MSPAGFCLRILVAWLLAMQPMAGAYAAIGVGSGPLQAELCRGGASPAPLDIPVSGAQPHCACCLTGCTSWGPCRANTAFVRPPADENAAQDMAVGAAFVANAGIGLQSPRGPPL